MYIDIVFALFILVGLIQGFHRGVIRTLFAILGIIIGFLAALKFAPFVVTFFESTLKLSPLIALIAGLILTFLAIMLGIRWLGKKFEDTLKLAKVNIVNKVAGAVIFALLMILTYSAIIWFVSQTKLISDAEKERSLSYPFLKEIPVKTGVVVEKLKPVFRDFWDKVDDVINPEQKEERISEDE